MVPVREIIAGLAPSKAVTTCAKREYVDRTRFLDIATRISYRNRRLAVTGVSRDTDETDIPSSPVASNTFTVSNSRRRTACIR